MVLLYDFFSVIVHTLALDLSSVLASVSPALDSPIGESIFPSMSLSLPFNHLYPHVSPGVLSQWNLAPSLLIAEAVGIV